MKNYHAPADGVQLTAPYAVTPGDGMLVGSLFAVASKTAASGVLTDGVTEGMFYLPTVSAETAAEGATAFWDAANRRVSVSAGVAIGHFAYAKLSGETSTRVRLQASALVSGAGISAKPRILFIGDSITDYGVSLQNITMSTSPFPFGGSAFSLVQLSWANGSGTSGTLTFNKAGKTLRWTAPGDAPGVPVSVALAGVYSIPSGDTAKTISVVCRPRLYSSATEGDFTVTTTVATEVTRRSARTYGYWVHGKACSGFDITLLGNGGSQIADVTECASWQVQSGAYDAIVCLVGTNDISADRTAAQIKADYAALISALRAKTPRLYFLTMLPRSSNMTTARRQIMASANRWVMDQRATGLTTINAFTWLADPASATAGPIAGMLEDGLHPAAMGAEAIGEAVYQAISTAFVFDPSPVASSQADTYDATNNPFGNHLPAGGTFAVAGGTAGTGVSGTIPLNWSVSREVGADILCVGSQIARTDGRPGLMQRFVVTNPGATDQRILIAPLNATRPAVNPGEVWRLSGAIVPSALTNTIALTNSIEPVGTSGAFNSTFGSFGVSGSGLSGTKRKTVMEVPPLTIPAGVSLVNAGFRIQVQAGGSATVDMLPGEWSLWRES